MGKRKRNFVTRTIKNGQVTIFGKIFKPTDRWLKYDGRLDGTRWAFGLYWQGDKQLSFVELWGTEEAYIAAYEVETWSRYCEEEGKSAAVVQDENGVWYHPWATWKAEGEEMWPRPQSEEAKT